MKQLILVGVTSLLYTYHLNAQKDSKNSIFQEVVHLVTATNSKSFKMCYPLDMKEASIGSHFGKTNIGKVYYYNEMVTFSSKLNAKAYCNVDEATVSSIAYDDGMYMIFLKKDNYTIVFCNLKKVTIKQGTIVKLGDNLGTLAPNEDDPEKACLELMLFEGDKMLNPEKYIINSLSPPAILTIT
jgi:hypothetical protein